MEILVHQKLVWLGEPKVSFLEYLAGHERHSSRTWIEHAYYRSLRSPAAAASGAQASPVPLSQTSKKRKPNGGSDNTRASSRTCYLHNDGGARPRTVHFELPTLKSKVEFRHLRRYAVGRIAIQIFVFCVLGDQGIPARVVDLRRNKITFWSNRKRRTDVEILGRGGGGPQRLAQSDTFAPSDNAGRLPCRS
ncbi:hypothetical protein EVAR_47283_1 [Eumeta japonica]|uniref:Uncharacterized protein n=1 Tax=Eumeta variegata TaxID=151549 RepID=A0A4C1Z2G8_EUMVA|nr:hypothetical protein EVAR_47283_1 [Eumeta japonica]